MTMGGLVSAGPFGNQKTAALLFAGNERLLPNCSHFSDYRRANFCETYGVSTLGSVEDAPRQS